ncbi:hypothetical protein D3C73_977710 [compost metagenome]
MQVSRSAAALKISSPSPFAILFKDKTFFLQKIIQIHLVPNIELSMITQNQKNSILLDTGLFNSLHNFAQPCIHPCYDLLHFMAVSSKSMLRIIQINQMYHEEIRLFILDRVYSAFSRKIIQIRLLNPFSDAPVFHFHLNTV